MKKIYKTKIEFSVEAEDYKEAVKILTAALDKCKSELVKWDFVRG